MLLYHNFLHIFFADGGLKLLDDGPLSSTLAGSRSINVQVMGNIRLAGIVPSFWDRIDFRRILGEESVSQ